MNKIRKLDEETISQIAAGEVVERPASVVKELIENSIDANATDILVDIEDSGLSKIEVTDNGDGMSRKDITISVSPHTTSKITTIEDLSRVNSFGFRGEALNSIQSVSDLIIKSRQKESTRGTKVTLKKGKAPLIETVGMKEGTVVTVLNLFKNVPVRKKFLKSNTLEFRLIIETITDFCFANKKINFKLIHNGKTIIDETSTSTETKIKNFWGEDIFENLLPLKHNASFFELSGFIGKPQISTNSTNKFLIYVNNRRVSNKLILSAVKEGFGTLLMARSYPVGIIFLEIPPQFVDVNVHPTKKEVRFNAERELYVEMQSAVISLLSKHNLTYQNVSFLEQKTIRDELKDVVYKTKISKLKTITNTDIFQLHKSYLIHETPEGVQIIDQHAAHESLLYFEFLDAFNKKSGQKIQLSTPLLFNLSVTDELLLKEYMEDLEKIGFEIDSFGEHSYRVTKVPGIYKDIDVKTVVTNLLTSLSENKTRISEREHLMLATLACKSAIKAGELLTDTQKHDLIFALSEKHLAYTCPHGRPVKLNITLSQLSRMFKRS